MNPAAEIWKKRYSAHIRTVARYTVYAGQSGFFLFLLAALIGSSYLYGRTIARIPETFPYALAITCWLTPFLAVSPIRTLLREADLVFLLPLEAKMGAYFRRALHYSMITQSFAVLFAVAASLPLYRHGFGAQAHSLLALAAFVLALKYANLLGAWAEGSFVRKRRRALFRSARWLGDALIVYALYRFGLLAGGAALLACLAVMGAWAAWTRKMKVNWPYLRGKEVDHNLRVLLFFNTFVDVDELPVRIKPRKLLSRLARLVPFRQADAFRFLYALTLLRSELFGIAARLTLVALAILLFLNSPWPFAAVYLLFQLITNVQLHTLGRFHRHSVWSALYPVPSELRPTAASRVAFTAQLVQVVILALPLFRPAVFTPWLLGLPLLGLAIAFAFRRRAGRTENQHS